MDEEKHEETICERYDVPPTTCYLKFTDYKRFDEEKRCKYSDDIGYTVRGEQMIADYDEDGNILGIELLGSKEAEKPCQKSA
jgi:uncharacterized protein YuzE